MVGNKISLCRDYRFNESLLYLHIPLCSASFFTVVHATFAFAVRHFNITGWLGTIKDDSTFKAEFLFLKVKGYDAISNTHRFLSEHGIFLFALDEIHCTKVEFRSRIDYQSDWSIGSSDVWTDCTWTVLHLDGPWTVWIASLWTGLSVWTD